eukprot:TRINITY_DN31858_c0_g1_i2.p1 TRINITY_DN31858_c0_g1~~TRINITY_DN31858_c0_g1_i2.p1  ORF type:complete len:406 (-),score=87.29 TRINITY_DN31858_c0_g1_i2:163-1380(-)
MGGEDVEGDSGPLYGMFTVVMAALGGKTHNTMSASLMCMARLLYEFMPQLSVVLPKLVPAVSELLKIKSTELVTAILGFMKVVVMRAPQEILEDLLPDILNGILSYAEESKHKFKLHVRLIVQRLSKRYGYDMVEKNIPEKDRRLVSHIRQQQNRKTRKRMDNEMQLDFDVGSQRSFGKSMKKSEWGHTKVFEIEEDDEDAQIDRQTKNPKSSKNTVPPSRDVVDIEEDGDPMDLQDVNVTGKVFVPKSGSEDRKDVYKKFGTDDSGKILIKEDDITGKKRTKRDGDEMEVDEEDSDNNDDVKGVGGIKTAKSDIAKSTRSSLAGSRKQSRGGSVHSGQRYKAKKGAGGDAKGKAKLEPYSYVKLNRQMLNKRIEKRKHAKKELDGVVKAVKVGAGKTKKRKLKL